MSAEEADLLCKKLDDKMQREHGLFFEKIGSRILRPRKCTYHTTQSQHSSTSGVFYRGQCDDSTPRKRTSENQKRKWIELSGPSVELIASCRYPQRNRRKPTYTYPVIQDQLKQSTDSDPPPSFDRAVDDGVTDTDKPENKREPSENAKGDESIPKPKGALQTTFYGVKKTRTDKLQKRKWSYQCPVCSNSYPNQSLLNNHYKDSHPPITCKICSLTFNTPSTLARHMYVHGELKFFCKDCNKGFPFEKDRDKHAISHKKVKSHFCIKLGCDKGFFNEHDLKKHVKVHDKKSWNCPQCKYSTLDEQNPKAHMRVHSDLKPDLCLKCLQLFKYHVQLVRHQSNPDISCSDKDKYGKTSDVKKWSSSLEY